MHRDREVGMRLILTLVAALLDLLCCSGSVRRDFPSPAAAASESLQPVDFSGIEKDLEGLISAETENVDRRDRLEAAWELCQRVKTQRPAAQHAVLIYLERTVVIERRIADAATDALANLDEQSFVPIAAITAERIAESDVAVKPSGDPVRRLCPQTLAPRPSWMRLANAWLQTTSRARSSSWLCARDSPVARRPSRSGGRPEIGWYTSGEAAGAAFIAAE